MARRSRRTAKSPELPSSPSPPLEALPTNRKRVRAADTSMNGKDSPALALAAGTSSPSKSNTTRKQQAKKRKQDKPVATEDEQLVQALASSLEDAPGPKQRVNKGKAKAVDQDHSQPEINPDSNLAALRKEITFKDTLIQNQTSLLESLRTTIACTICLETLELPYSLACGHIFCRKCLLVWFHRVDVNAEPAAANEDDDDDVESVNSEIIVAPPAVDESSSDDTSSEDDGAPPTKRQAMLNTLVKRPRQKTLQELADETTGSDSSDDGNSRRPKPGSIRGTLGKHKFTVTGGNQTGIFSALEKAMYSMADSLSNGTGDAKISEMREEFISATGGDLAPPSREEMRLARLARFGAEGGAVSTAVNAAAGPSGARSSPRLATAHQPSPPRVTRRIIVDTSEDDAPPPRRSPPPPVNPPPIPTGDHRIKNLVCPHCRDAVDRAPIRIFVLSEIVTLIRAAEATGLVGLGTASEAQSQSTSTSAPLPGMVETDLSWGGLFDVIGAETKEQKKARRAVVMDDNEDGVRRCGNCNWEIDETNGLCEGCGREWDLSAGEQSADSFRGDAFPLGAGYNSNEGRSIDEEDSESDDGFVVKSSPPARVFARWPIILSDSEIGESGDSEGEVEVVYKRSFKKERSIVVESEDEPVAVKPKRNRVVELESDEEDKPIAVKPKKRPTVVESEDEEDEPVAVKPKKSQIVEIESDQEAEKASEGLSEEDEDEESDDADEDGTRSGGEFGSGEEWENDPDHYRRAPSNSPSVDSEAAYREECW